MRSKFKVLCSLLCVFLLTGCVKMEVNMDIHKDKSMDMSIVEAVASSLMNQADSAFDEGMLEEAKNQGFKVEKYSENDKEGYKFTKSISNIDEVSSKDSVVGDLGVGKDSGKYLFTVKPGLFKNKYTAKLKSSDVDQVNERATTLPDNSDEGATLADDDALDTNDTMGTDDLTDDSTEDDTLNSDMDLSALSSMMGSMELNYTVNLPYKALSSNATSVNNDGKKLSWDLTKIKDNIEFEFELYNMNNIYIAGGVAALFVIIIVLIIISKIKKGKKGNPVLVEEPAVNLDNTAVASPAPATTLNTNEGVVASETLRSAEPVVEQATAPVESVAPVVEQAAVPVEPAASVVEPTVTPVEPAPVESLVSEVTEPAEELTVSDADQEVNSVNSVSSFDPVNATIVNSQEKADEIFADNKNLN